MKADEKLTIKTLIQLLKLNIKENYFHFISQKLMFYELSIHQ